MENQAPDAVVYETFNFDALLTKKDLAEVGTVVGDRFVMDHPDSSDPAPVRDDAQTIDANHDGESETVRAPRRELPSIVRIPTRFPKQDSFLLLQKWEGVVTR